MSVIDSGLIVIVMPHAQGELPFFFNHWEFKTCDLKIGAMPLLDPSHSHLEFKGVTVVKKKIKEEEKKCKMLASFFFLNNAISGLQNLIK